jgi:hypothetical protein
MGLKKLSAVCVAALLLLGVFPAPASAATLKWIDGLFAYQYDTYCDLLGGNTIETAAISYVGYYGAMDLTWPLVGQPYVGHIVTGAAGNGCYAGYQLLNTEVTLPPSTSLTIDAAHPIKCYFISSRGVVSDVTADPTVNCVQTAQAGIHGGQYSLGQRIVPTGGQFEIQFWMTTSAVLKGSQTSTDRMYGYVTDATASPFTVTPFQWVWVSATGGTGTPNVSYPNPSATLITDTTGTITTVVNCYGLTGNISFDIGTTTAYGYTTTTVAVPPGYTSYNVWANITGMTPGTLYHWRGKFAASNGTTYYGSDQMFTTTNNGAEVLPFVSNAAYGGYTTTVYVMNAGSAPAHFSLAYFDQNGNPVGLGDSATVAVNATWTVSQNNGRSFAAGQAGSAILFSDQPLSAFVNEFAPGGGDATSYTAIASYGGLAQTLYAPAIARAAYGGYTTGIGLINLSNGPANITITYRDSAGNQVKQQGLAQVPAHAYRAVYSGVSGSANDAGLAAGFAGTATITSDNGLIAAIVNEVGPGGQFSSYGAIAAGATTLGAPVALKAAYGGYNTGMAIQNTTANTGSVTVTYYASNGAATPKTFSIAANAYLGVYQGGTDGPNTNGAYTAVITSTVAIAAIVNEVAPVTGSAQQSTSYNTSSGTASPIDLPLVTNASSDGWSTGLGIMNMGATSTTITVSYFLASTGAAVGTPQTITLAPYAAWGLYQPTGGLPAGTRATAVVSSAGLLAVICNESSATSFMSYSGQ